MFLMLRGSVPGWRVGGLLKAQESGGQFHVYCPVPTQVCRSGLGGTHAFVEGGEELDVGLELLGCLFKSLVI